MTVVQLRELARANKVRLPYGVNKAQMVETLFRQLGSGMKPAQAPAEQPDIGLYKPKPLGFYDEEYGTSNPVVPQMLKAGLLGSGHGLLEVQPGGYGFLRAQNGTPGADDIYVSIAQIRRFNLHSGDEIVGKTRPKRMGDRYNALMYIESVNGENPEIARVRRPFDSLTPIHPNRRLTLEGEGEPGDPSMRLMDFIAPIGLGQRALIVAPPKAGKTILLQKIARAIEKNHPDIELMILLIDERPEEVTDIRRSVRANVFYSTFDSPQENHVRVADMVYERAQRLVEQGKNVVVLMDSLTRLARACNAMNPSGRAMSGGLAPGALDSLPDAENVIYMAGKKFGTDGNEYATWAMNTWLPSRVAERYQNSRIVVFSSGNLYPKVGVHSGGATEETRTEPVGEYCMSCQGRERMFEYAAKTYGTRVAVYRLNYAVDLRYGVLYDMAHNILEGKPISITTPSFNCIWQGDANEAALRLLGHASAEVFTLNVTGPETAGVQETAKKLGALLGREPIFTGEASDTAYLNNAGKMFRLFGYPTVPLETLIEWQAQWILDGGRALGKPTHFEERKGSY